MVKTSSVSKTKRPKIDFEKLNRWNGGLAVVYLLQAVALVISAKGKTAPVSLDLLGQDTLATEAKGKAVLAPATHHLFDVSLVWALALFLLTSAVVHFLMATYLRERYEKQLAKRANPIRWIGYGVSAGLMTVAVGLLVGVQSFVALLMLFVLVAGMGGLYSIAEYYLQKAVPARTFAYWIGSVAGLVAWLALGLVALGSHIYGAGVFVYLHFVGPATFLLLAAISVNFWLQLRGTGKWADFMYGERVFVIASFLAQTALTWSIFGGSLRP